MSDIIENVFECLTVEIEVKKGKNFCISCVYRTQVSYIDTFSSKLIGILGKLNGDKVQFVCGDFDIDRLNTNSTVYTMYNNNSSNFS